MTWGIISVADVQVQWSKYLAQQSKRFYSWLIGIITEFIKIVIAISKNTQLIQSSNEESRPLNLSIFALMYRQDDLTDLCCIAVMFEQ